MRASAAAGAGKGPSILPESAMSAYSARLGEVSGSSLWEATKP